MDRKTSLCCSRSIVFTYDGDNGETNDKMNCIVRVRISVDNQHTELNMGKSAYQVSGANRLILCLCVAYRVVYERAVLPAVVSVGHEEFNREITDLRIPRKTFHQCLLLLPTSKCRYSIE